MYVCINICTLFFVLLLWFVGRAYSTCCHGDGRRGTSQLFCSLFLLLLSWLLLVLLFCCGHAEKFSQMSGDFIHDQPSAIDCSRWSVAVIGVAGVAAMAAVAGQMINYKLNSIQMESGWLMASAAMNYWFLPSTLIVYDDTLIFRLAGWGQERALSMLNGSTFTCERLGVCVTAFVIYGKWRMSSHRCTSVCTD